MQKCSESSAMEPCRTRLSIKLSYKKSKFTASDIEIISDLEELSYFTKRAQMMKIIESQLPSKRKRKVKKCDSLEDDALNALSSLIQLSIEVKKNKNFDEKQQSKVIYQRKESDKKKFDRETNCPNQSSCKNNEEFASNKTEENIQLEIAWITQLLEVNS